VKFYVSAFVGVIIKVKFLSLGYLLILAIEVGYIEVLRLTVCLFIALYVFHKGMCQINFNLA